HVVGAEPEYYPGEHYNAPDLFRESRNAIHAGSVHRKRNTVERDGKRHLQRRHDEPRERDPQQRSCVLWRFSDDRHAFRDRYLQRRRHTLAEHIPRAWPERLLSIASDPHFESAAGAGRKQLWTRNSGGERRLGHFPLDSFGITCRTLDEFRRHDRRHADDGL